MQRETKIGVLFVCLGNICRSPLAEGVFRAELASRGLEPSFVVDSCGTGGWHVGEAPDGRSVQVAAQHGVDISGQRSRKLAQADYGAFAWIVAMDAANHRDIKAREPSGSAAHIVSFMSWVSDAVTLDVPDPYYGGPGGFEHVYELLVSGMAPLLDAVLEAQSA
jgi:protein-tyrosine phosphatase